MSGDSIEYLKMAAVFFVFVTCIVIYIKYDDAKTRKKQADLKAKLKKIGEANQLS